MGKLYYGDNLEILRQHIHAESVDLIYLDPPFNSKRGYNLLFRTPKGHESEAQVTAFEDTWHWGPQAEKEYDELLHQSNTDVAEMIQSLRRFLKENDVMAYLVMMANRLLEMQRVLKPTGSLYLHCDTTASHYLKVVLDAVFGGENFRNEIIWCYRKWSVAQNQFVHNHDVILFYSRSKQNVFNVQYVPLSEGTLKRWKGKKQQADFTADGKRIAGNLEQESEGSPMPDWWEISIINPASKERLGYPTQKPLALLERIIQASSNPGDLVLDPFCGCGTAVHAAQKLGREWIGIDITHLAIGLIEKRMHDAFPDLIFDIHGTPKDHGGAQALAERDKYQFQWWACSLVGAQPYQGKKKGADSGIDGIIYFQDEKGPAKKIVVSVKGGEHVGVTMIRDLLAVVEREKASIGLFVTLAPPTQPMLTEATSAGYYKSALLGAFPKLQVLTIEGLLSGIESPRYPDLTRGAVSFKKAPQEKPEGEQQQLF
jgi:site-specific DNA-methyltransferase (adenine-specific)